MVEYSIGEFGKATATKVPMIRYYEKIGLLPEPVRTEGNQRRYDDDHVRRLTFIRHVREFGFPLAMVKELLSLADDPGHACSDVDRIARVHLASVEQRIRTLGLLKTELERMIEQCKGGTVSECRIIEALARYSLPAADPPSGGKLLVRRRRGKPSGVSQPSLPLFKGGIPSIAFELDEIRKAALEVHDGTIDHEKHQKQETEHHAHQGETIRERHPLWLERRLLWRDFVLFLLQIVHIRFLPGAHVCHFTGFQLNRRQGSLYSI